MKFFQMIHDNPEPPPRPRGWIEEGRLPELRGEVMTTRISGGEMGELIWRMLEKLRELEDRIRRLE